MENIIGGRPNLKTAVSSRTFAEMGMNSENTEIVYQFDNDGMRSWKPGRQINFFNKITAGKEYYIIAKQTLDLSNDFTPPTPFGFVFVLGDGNGNVIGNDDNTVMGVNFV